MAFALPIKQSLTQPLSFATFTLLILSSHPGLAHTSISNKIKETPDKLM